MIKDNHRSTYTIHETALLSGLPESTLRYYETIGLIHPIRRDASSKHRVYDEDDLEYAIAVSCLNAVGMSLEDMRAYLRNRGRGAESAQEQVELLEAHQQRLAEEAHFLALRQRYVDAKIAYWKAVHGGSDEEIARIGKHAKSVAAELRNTRASQDAQREAARDGLQEK